MALNGRTKERTDEMAMSATRRAVADLTGSSDDATLGDGIAAAHRVRQSADTLVTELVIAARSSGATWADIGEVLGVSTQAAHQKYRFITES